LNRNRLACIVAAAGLLPIAGCNIGGDANPGVIPENKDAKQARALIENPASVVPQPQAKAGAKSKGALPPQPPK
jgi:hypothetical protein